MIVILCEIFLSINEQFPVSKLRMKMTWSLEPHKIQRANPNITQERGRPLHIGRLAYPVFHILLLALE